MVVGTCHFVGVPCLEFHQSGIMGINFETRKNLESSFVRTSNDVVNLAPLWDAPFGLRSSKLAWSVTRNQFFKLCHGIMAPFCFSK